MHRIFKRLGNWFKGYDDAPLWLCSCRVIFAVSSLALIASFFGPAVFGGDIIGFWTYQKWTLTNVGFLYMIVIVISFTLAIISGIPTLVYEKKKMKQMKNEAKK